MCKACSDLVREILPQVPDDQQYGLLMGATCFPFGGPELIAPQLREIARMFEAGYLGEDLVDGACAWADAQLSAEHELIALQDRDWS